MSAGSTGPTGHFGSVDQAGTGASGPWPGFDPSAPPAIAATSSTGAATTAARGDHTHEGVHSVNGLLGDVTVSGISSVANFAALGALASASLTEGASGYVQSAKEIFLLVLSGAATRTNYRIAASGKAGYQWVRQLGRHAYWEVQPTWVVDPTNSSGTASDDNSGLDAAHALLTYQEMSWRLWQAEINQTTTVTFGPGDQQTGDNPTWSYVCRGQSLIVANGIPTTVYSSTVTGYVAAAFGTTAADDCEFSDAAVPGGSFTAAGALGQGVFIKRTSGTVIYSAVLKDLGGTTCRVAQPYNPASGTANVAFAPGDAYQLIKLPAVTSWVLPSSGNLATKFSFVTWNVAPNTTNGINSTQFIVSYIEKTPRFSGLNIFFGGCCIDSGGGSWETGANSSINPFQMCSFKGTGATRYSFAGGFSTENSIISWQGCNLLLENGFWNSGQMAFYDSTLTCVSTGTASRIHFLGPISGKGNTSKLVSANQASQIVTQNIPVATGSFFTAASTSDALPIQASGTTSAVAIPLDVNMNGVFPTQ